MQDDEIQQFLEQQAKSHPNLKFEELFKLYDQKKYHELTILLLELLKVKEFQLELNQIYTNFIKFFQSKMNKISLIKIVSICASQKQPQLALDFLNTFDSELKDDEEGQLLLLSQKLNYLLMLSRFDDCLEKLNECQKLMENKNFDIVINASYYRASANYYKVLYLIGYQRLSKLLPQCSIVFEQH